MTIVDTLTTIVFFTMIAGFTELFVVGMEPVAVLKTRVIMIPMMIVTGRPYGAWRDLVFKKAKPATALSKSVADGVAFLSFQLPVYAATLWIAGASGREILALLATTSLLMLLVSRPFGLVLDTVRKCAGVSAT
ncbi:L-alanine exporter AlaE [Sulfitobacter noctilucicola]|uniref:L-alanine exporter AlaE n=1 Tax=Sulfitobacter noctilucicola TaxID=1342301 RepID=A0A7W6Q4G2_9RHOB|nr:L-alanine exporter AlaE [Sulfitobacter noctilucicola]KIN63855.1 L-alanine exporter AlaE [Sulfitobacter noctilucicola]MBB4174638.1 hypothetical protein [Sulfitobacter noctilucicola]